MDIRLSDGYEVVTINTNILWWLKTGKTFNQLLGDALTSLESKGFKVIEDLDSYDYLMDNLPQFITSKAVK